MPYKMRYKKIWLFNFAGGALELGRAPPAKFSSIDYTHDFLRTIKLEMKTLSDEKLASAG